MGCPEQLSQGGQVNGLLTVTQAAQRLQVHPNTVRRYIAEGRLNAVNLTKDSKWTTPRWRISSDELERFVQGRAK